MSKRGVILAGVFTLAVCFYLSPLILAVLSAYCFVIKLRPLSVAIALYDAPYTLGITILIGPTRRFFAEIRASETSSTLEKALEKFKGAANEWSLAPPRMGYISTFLFALISTVYLLFYFPLMFATFIYLGRFTPKRFRSNHQFSWFLLFTFLTYKITSDGFLDTGLVFSCILVIVALGAIFMSLRVNKGAVLLYSYAKFQMRLSIIGESAASVVLAFGSLHYLISNKWAASYSSSLSALDSLYFSAVTFATVGYGDIFPRAPIAKAACVAEIASGILVLIVAVSATTSIWLQKHQPVTKYDAEGQTSK